MPGPVTVTKRGGGGGSPLENWSVTWTERERERETGWWDLNPDGGCSDTE